MKMPGFTAEASLVRLSFHYESRGGKDFSEFSSVIPQQFEPPGFTISCSPCRLRIIFRFGVPHIEWRESVRNCVYRSDPTHPEGGHYVCGPCIEQRCPPFVVIDRFNLP